MTIHVHEFAWRGELFPSPREGNALVGTASSEENSEGEDDPEQSSDEPCKTSCVFGFVLFHGINYWDETSSHPTPYGCN